VQPSKLQQLEAGMRLILRLTAAALILAATFAAGRFTYAHAQVPQPQNPPAQLRPQPRDPLILSGSDFGFRVEGYGRDGQPLGRIVVRVDGRWVEPRETGGVVPLTSR
jgi:hypothetical protein